MHLLFQRKLVNGLGSTDIKILQTLSHLSEAATSHVLRDAIGSIFSFEDMV